MIDGVNMLVKLTQSPAAFSIMWANVDDNEVPPPIQLQNQAGGN